MSTANHAAFVGSVSFYIGFIPYGSVNMPRFFNISFSFVRVYNVRRIGIETTSEVEYDGYARYSRVVGERWWREAVKTQGTCSRLKRYRCPQKDMMILLAKVLFDLRANNPPEIVPHGIRAKFRSLNLPRLPKLLFISETYSRRLFVPHSIPTDPHNV